MNGQTLLTDDQKNRLREATPRSVIKKLKKGNSQLDYVEHGYVTGQLNEIFNWTWHWEIVEWKIMERECIVYGRLTITTEGGPIVKEQFGANPVNAGMMAGDALKGASSDALKKCASLLGIALDLYSDDLTPHEAAPTPTPQDEAKQSKARFFRDAVSLGYKTPDDVVEAMRALGYRETPLDPQTQQQALHKLADRLQAEQPEEAHHANPSR